MNILIFFGFTAGLQLDESVGFFVTLEGGVNFLQFIFPEYVFKINQENFFRVTANKSEVFIKPCLSIEVGIKIAKRFIIYGEYFTLLDSKSKVEIDQQLEFLGRFKNFLQDRKVEVDG